MGVSVIRLRRTLRFDNKSDYEFILVSDGDS